MTAYDLADDNGHEDVKKLLIDAGARPQAVFDTVNPARLATVNPARLAEGTPVSGQYQSGSWYSARIAARNEDGSYDVAWEDGDPLDTTGKTAPMLRIKLAQLEEQHRALLAAGDPVDGLYKKRKWYPAKIAKIDAATIELEWDDGDTEDASKKSNEVRIALNRVLQKMS